MCHDPVWKLAPFQNTDTAEILHIWHTLNLETLGYRKYIVLIQM